MNKKMIVILIMILASIVCVICCWKYFAQENMPEMKWYKNESGKNYIEAENLRITVKGFYKDNISNEQFSNLQLNEENIQNIKRQMSGEGYYTLIEMTRLDGKETIGQNINYIVYDNKKNIITNSIIKKKNATTKLFITRFVKPQFNSSKLPNNELAEHTIPSFHWGEVPVWSNEDSMLFMIFSRKGTTTSYGVDQKPDPILDLSKINVLIVNPSYIDVETKENIELENSIFEFEV